MTELSLVFKALSEPIRLRIVRQLLHNGKEAYGEQLARALRIPAYQLSRHLKVLKATGLIHERRQGRWVYYSLVRHHPTLNGQLLGALRRFIVEKPPAPASRPSVRTNGRKANGRRQRDLNQLDVMNWSQGPAIPGIL